MSVKLYTKILEAASSSSIACESSPYCQFHSCSLFLLCQFSCLESVYFGVVATWNGRCHFPRIIFKTLSDWIASWQGDFVVKPSSHQLPTPRSDGSSYEGNMEEGKMHGQGRFVPRWRSSVRARTDWGKWFHGGEWKVYPCIPLKKWLKQYDMAGFSHTRIIMDHPLASLRITVPGAKTKVWPDGSSYEGSWFQGALHGQGRFDSRFDGGRYMQGVRFFSGRECAARSCNPVIFFTVVWKRHETVQTATTDVWQYETLWVVRDSICIFAQMKARIVNFLVFFARNPAYCIHPHTLLFKVMLHNQPSSFPTLVIPQQWIKRENNALLPRRHHLVLSTLPILKINPESVVHDYRVLEKPLGIRYRFSRPESCSSFSQIHQASSTTTASKSPTDVGLISCNTLRAMSCESYWVWKMGRVCCRMRSNMREVFRNPLIA